jgi:acetyl-CoA synthase
MEKLIELGITGARNVFIIAEDLFRQAISEKGEKFPLTFPGTAYYLPLAYSFLGEEVAQIGDVHRVLIEAKKLLEGNDEQSARKALDAGMATLLLAEIIAVIRYLKNEEPQPDCEGFFTDSVLRSLGLKLVGGKIPGFALIIGAAPDTASAVSLVRDFQRKNILTFVGGSSGEISIIDQLKEAGIETGWGNYLVPYGRDVVSTVFPINWAVRVALSFGGLKKGDRVNLLNYSRKRLLAAGLKLGEITPEEIAAAWGAINLGFPVVVHGDLPRMTLPGICEHEALLGEPDIRKLAAATAQARGIKTKIAAIPLPVAYSPAFHGERVRKEETFVQFGGQLSTSIELLTVSNLEEVEDGKIEVLGKDLQGMRAGEVYPLSLWIEVAGRKMVKDFEPVLERQLHDFINYAEGIFHIGQRDMNWIRISEEAYRKGFLLSHLGNIIHARLHQEFGTIVDKVQISISTETETVEELLARARKIYRKRNEAIAGLTDEGVDEFYTCTLCQSFATHHVCIVKPERPGLCGAYNWLDCKVSHEINPSGPNRPVKKGKLIDPVMGEWEGVNQAVWEESRKRLERFHAYSIMTFPETSCGCFECIVALVPEANGFMVVSRTYIGMTPTGMTFTTLAGSIGGGEQTPGFAGIGRLYLVSKKFLKADGGIRRIVWMPKELKEFLGERFAERCVEEGVPGLMDKIADEGIGLTPEELLEFLQRVDHPVLHLEPLL